MNRSPSRIVASDKDDFLESFCKGALGKDHFIRFAGVSNHLGHLIATAYRRDLVPLMTPEETSRYAVQAAIRAATRETFESKIGELQFSISRYNKLVRATIPIKSSGKNRFLLLLSFDVDAEADSIINKKIFPYVMENKDYFM
ncbi:MAG TPA: hypothetical protein VHL10_05730 [Nitrososphaera sp.]|nr:hypothetical protein [Nitrososphaera sp.]